MPNSIRAEVRKLLSVRSTYIITGLLVIFMAFIAFWVKGYSQNGPLNSSFLMRGIFDVVPIVSVATVVVAILLMGHEYRYNTLIYSLTATNSRSRFVLSKILVVAAFTTIVLAIVMAEVLLLPQLGVNLSGHSLPAQNLALASIFLKMWFYCIGFTLTGLLFAILIRNLIFSLIFMFIVPNTVETIMTLIFKKNAIYLPFSALSQVIGTNTPSDNGPLQIGRLSPAKGALVFSVYFVIAWLLTWYLFLRRDALKD